MFFPSQIKVEQFSVQYHVFSIVPQFFHSKSKFHSTIVLNYYNSKLQLTIVKYSLLYSFLLWHYHILSLSDLCQGVKKRIFQRNNAFSLIWPRPSTRAPKIYNFGRPFLGHHYSILILPDLCPGVETYFLKKEIHQFYIFKPKIISF